MHTKVILKLAKT